MVFIVKDPILTYFNSISTTFHGFGINLYIGENAISKNFVNENLSFKYARVTISTQDPTRGALVMQSPSHMDNIFNLATYSVDGFIDEEGTETPSSADTFFTAFKSANYKGVYTFVPPSSWLDVDGYLTGEDALRGYANFILSGILWIRSFGVSADFVELFPEPDIHDNVGSVYPKDLVIIANRIRDLSISRNIPNIKIFGPGLGSLLPGNIDQELWTESFVFSKRSLDFFSIHANENISDATIYNSGSIIARKLVETRLRKSVAQMMSINASNERFVTSFSTRATNFPTSLYSPSSPGDGEDEEEGEENQQVDLSDTIEFSLRVMENLVGIMSNGFNSAFYETLSPLVDSDGIIIDEQKDSRSLFNIDGTPRHLTKLWNKIFSNVPIPGNIYRSEEINAEEDFTVKTCIMSPNGNRFCFILCRPVNPDNLMGRVRLTINNPLWSSNYIVENIAVTSYPDPAVVTETETMDPYGAITIVKTVGPGVNLSEVVTKPTMNLNYMSLFVKGLPYGGCVIFLTGTVRLKDPVVPTPAPTPTPTPSPSPAPDPGQVPPDSSPVFMQTIMQMPVNYGEPTRYTNYDIGTVYYDSRDKCVKTFIDGTWVTSHLLSYI